MESHEESWNTIPHVILTALTKASFEEKKNDPLSKAVLSLFVNFIVNYSEKFQNY